jgi:hypothetical protein
MKDAPMSARSSLFGHRHPRISTLTQSLRAFLALGLAALIFASPFGFIVSAREVSRQNTASKTAANYNPGYVQNQEGAVAGSKPQTSDVDSFIIEMIDGVATCRDATLAEVPLTLPRPDDKGVPVKDLTPVAVPGENIQAPGSENDNTPLTINLVALSQLQNDPNKDAVIAAFQKAAAVWTARIKSPTTVTVNIDYGANSPGGGAFGPNTLGSTGSQRTTIDYPGFLTNLKAGSNGAAETAIYNALPASFVPTDVGNGAVVSVARSLARTLGLPVSTLPSADATIGFNNAFQFDFNPDDGIDANKTDFVAVAAHEIGHALGFSSNAGQGNTANVSALDVFRFRPGTTAGTFSSGNRIMSIGGTQVYFTGQTFPIFARLTSGNAPPTQTGTTTELGFSTGGPSGVTTDGGDGSQSSHWKADEQTQVFIGIMDPTISKGIRIQPTENDYSALETMGWDLTGNAVVPPAPPSPAPPANDNFTSAVALAGCSGSTTGTNVGATKEPGELDNPDSPTAARSVWYNWTAPGTGNATIDTSGSGFDTVLAVYTGNAVGGLTLVANNDDATAGQDLTSAVTFNATAGTTYRINVNGFNNSGSGGDFGTFKLNWNQSNCSVTPTPTPTPPTTGPATLSLSSGSFNANEGDAAGALSFTVTRTGDPSAAVSVDFITSDGSGQTPCQTNGNGIASDRCDYATAVGTLRFAAGDNAPKTVQIPVINDSYVEPAEVFQISLRNPQGASLSIAAAAATIFDNDTQAATTNPIDGQAFFIREQYIDFLGRIPDPAGFQFWTDRMNSCPAGQICDRTDTSQRFFQSDEFQERGFYVYRLYDGLLVRLPKYAEFVPDVARLNGFQSVAEQRASKDAYLTDFINKTEFKNIYGSYLSANGLTATNPTGFVNELCTRSGITPASKQTLINNLQSGARDPAHTIEDFILTPEMSTVGTKFYDRGFITMQYFGYLRRDPEAAGFDFWQGQLIGTNAPHRGDYRFMVGGFLQSDEYRFRFAMISATP